MKKIFRFVWSLFFSRKQEKPTTVAPEFMKESKPICEPRIEATPPEEIPVVDPEIVGNDLEIVSDTAKQPERVEVMSRSQIRQIFYDDGIIYLDAYEGANINQIRKTVFFMRKKHIVLFNNKLRAYIYKGLRTEQKSNQNEN